MQCDAVGSASIGHAPRNYFKTSFNIIKTYLLAGSGERNDSLCKHVCSIICKQSAGTQEVAEVATFG